MRRAVLQGVLVCLLLGIPVSAAALPGMVAVTTDRPRLSTVLGERFTIETELRNTGAATGPMLAHLNVASITGDVYVDPEDWSSERSQEVSLQPGERTTLSWDLQAVNSGSFAAYVVVLPYGTTVVGWEDLVVSPLVRLEVAPRSTLTLGGALPVVVAVPVLLGLAAAVVRLRVRRRS